ncbi:MAG TPA: NYN domain-containing protein [Ilumatobacteraceae bacterium]|nr:NYN domain-containing protein [Ilumatobacteraceae bacterium]HRB03276.1 NYN domain-containing protein [Ilumatobacteraceae bacterium]
MPSETSPDVGADSVIAPLSDSSLQSALEFAVGIAAAGSKIRPPLPFPKGLKPYLRFQRLPPTALAKVREAVEADSVFLGRLGSVATDELLDEVGMLWLARPDGWQVTAAEIVAKATNAPLDDAAELRREQRRRDAAEASAIRSRLEVAAVREQLEAERSARTAADVELAEAREELAALRRREAELQRGVKKRARGADSAAALAGSIEAELAAARAELQAVVAARDAALADRVAVHGEPVGDIERVRALLTEALALTRGPSASTRRRRRNPIALPGGVYGNSEAAGEHLLRTADVVILVDGYNVAKLGWPALSLDRQREVCIEAAENLARRWGCLIHIVFDGASVVGAASRVRRLVRVSFSPEGVIADDVLRAEVAALDLDRPVVVVTNDKAVIADVRAAGANIVASDTFLALARR